MEKIIAVLVVSISFLYVPLAAAQDDKDKTVSPEMEQVTQPNGSVPEGMEKMRFKQTELVVPTGMRYKKKGNLVIMESYEEYTARKLADIEERLSKTEEQITRLSDKIKELSKIISQQQKTTPAPSQHKEPSK